MDGIVGQGRNSPPLSIVERENWESTMAKKRKSALMAMAGVA
jgi:hypothetical protein